MIRTDGAFTDCQRPLEKPLGLADAVRRPIVELRQIVQRARHVGMIGAEHLLADRQRALDQRLRLGEVALDLLDLAEIVQKRRDRGMFRTRRFLRSPARA